MNKSIYYVIMLLLNISQATATTSNQSKFDLNYYSQNIQTWINPKASNYNKPLLDNTFQQQQLQALKQHYFGTQPHDQSPWNAVYVTQLLQQNNLKQTIGQTLESVLFKVNNFPQPPTGIVYNNRYLPYAPNWSKTIKMNMNLKQLQHIEYLDKSRAIAVTNLPVRALPTNNHVYYNPQIPGEGYPFDLLQLSAIFVGTPLYILHTTNDGKWLLVLTPDYIGWVEAYGVATVDTAFINQWQRVANINLGGILTDHVTIRTMNQHHFVGYVGMVFPVVKYTKKQITLLVPSKGKQQRARITRATLTPAHATILPMPITPANFGLILKSLQGQPYGWGSLNFNTDCSAEMKEIFTLFGFFMPRDTKLQAYVGRNIDISHLDAPHRLKYLMQYGVPFLTLVHLKAHIFLYLGTYITATGDKVAVIYQQIWGLTPHDKKSRSVIGKSGFLPLLLQYPKYPQLISELDNSVFQLVYLNQLPRQDTPESLAKLKLQQQPNQPTQQTLDQLLGNN